MAYVTLVYLLCILSFGIALSARSVKKGLCVSARNYHCDDMKPFTNIAWWYDWSLQPLYLRTTNCTYKPTQARVPMFWGGVRSPNPNIPKSAKYILGFNEPNHKKQANKTPKKAAEDWLKIEAVAGNRTLVSPSANGCRSGPKRCISDVIPWFDEFFKICKNCRIDYLATHHYTCNAGKTMNFLKELYQRYGKKIWLTEFACYGPKSPERVLNYMKSVLPQLEKADFVYRYAWFTSRITLPGGVMGPQSLLKPNSPTLSDLGKYYNEFRP